MGIIEPIGAGQREEVLLAVSSFLRQAEDLFGRRFDQIPVFFDLTGRSAGMYVSGARGRRIRLNPYIFAKFFEDNLKTTVPHEVAHYVSDILYGLRHIRPHGAEWQQIMHGLGVTPRRTCNYDLEGVPVRHYRRFSYHCGCSSHMLTSRRHNKITGGFVRYSCRKCGDLLRLSGQGEP